VKALFDANRAFSFFRCANSQTQVWAACSLKSPPLNRTAFQLPSIIYFQMHAAIKINKPPVSIYLAHVDALTRLESTLTNVPL
jgi:hypothetical protein